jgi:hypothetical protein
MANTDGADIGEQTIKHWRLKLFGSTGLMDSSDSVCRIFASATRGRTLFTHRDLSTSTVVIVRAPYIASI